MWGHSGDDIYVVERSSDRVTEDDADGDDGIDEVRATISYTLPVFIENLLLSQQRRHQRHRQCAGQCVDRQWR